MQRTEWMVKCLRGVAVVALLLAGTVAHAQETQSVEGQELGLEGYPKGRRPDIIFLAPKLVEPAEKYAKAIETFAAQGVTLMNAELTLEGVQKEGIVPILKAADYTILQVKDVPWKDACARLDGLLKVRRKTLDPDPRYRKSLCTFIEEEATVEELAASLELLMKTEALIFFLPEPKSQTAPFIVYWRNLVCPGDVDGQQIRNVHWLPTFAEIVGLPTPASVPEPTILPLLTSVGYQRQIEPMTIQLPMPKNRDVYTTIWYYTELDEALPWVPDYTVDEFKPERRLFVRGDVPLSQEAMVEIHLRTIKEKTTGLYLRTRQAEVDLLLPKEVSCVVRVKGKTVLNRWKPAEEHRWKMVYASPVPVDFFFLIPPGYDPQNLPIFEKKPARSLVETLLPDAVEAAPTADKPAL